MERLMVTLAAEPERVRMLVRTADRDVLKAVLGPAHRSHARAAATMLEGLALWHQCPLSVVVCADEAGHTSALELYDGLGLGARTLHYEVGVAYHPRRTTRQASLRGLGDFRDLRQLVLPEVSR